MACMIFFMLLLGMTLFLWKTGRGKYDADITLGKNRKNSLGKWISVGLVFMDVIRYRYHTGYDKKLLRSFGELYGQREADRFLKAYWASKVCHILLILLIFSFFGSVLWLQEAASSGGGAGTVLLGGNELLMPAFGEGNREVALNADIRKGEKSQQQQYRVDIPEAAPPDDASAVGKAAERLTEGLIRGGNASLSRVSKRLSLKNHYDELKNLDVWIEWKSSRPAFIAADGTVAVPEDFQQAEQVILTAIISKGEEKQEKTFNVLLCKEVLTDEQVIAKVSAELKQNLAEIGDSAAAGENRVRLPTTSGSFHDVAISWFPQKNENLDSGITTVILAVIISGLAAYLMDNDINRQIEKRRMRIKYDFPDFLNKLLLLLNAGMTAGRAIEKIARDGRKETPLYKELRAAVNDMEGGRPESQAMEEFAVRCRIPEVSKFVSVLLQNRRKGNGELVSVLRLQSNECWEMRKNAAKRLGEEASTKLLLPLMLMLVAILMIVATPAILAMKGF